MKIKKIIFLLLLPFLGELVVSCCDCVEPTIQHYTNKTIIINNLDNSGKEPILSTLHKITKTAYGIRVQLNREKTACNEGHKSIFIPSAYALSCECPPEKKILPLDSIVDIKVFTLFNFDETHLAHSDISDYFKIYKPYSFTTINEFIKKNKSVLNDDGELQTEFDLLLMTAPKDGNLHQFKIQVTLSDGNILEQETSPIELI